MAVETEVHGAGIPVVGLPVETRYRAQVEAELLGEKGLTGIPVGVMDQGNLKLHELGPHVKRAGRLQEELVVAATARVGHLDGEYVAIDRDRFELEGIRLPGAPAQDNRRQCGHRLPVDRTADGNEDDGAGGNQVPGQVAHMQSVGLLPGVLG